MSRGFVSAGKLRERVSIQARSSTRNAVGEEVISWTTRSSNVPASITPLSMNERLNADRLQADIDKKVIIRYSSAVAPRDRLVWNSEQYDIRSIINWDERGHRVDLLVARVAT